MLVLRNHRRIQQKETKVTKWGFANLCFLRCLLFLIRRPIPGTLRLVPGTVCVSEQRFDLFLKDGIDGTGPFHYRGALKRIIALERIGQDRLYLLPSVGSHLDVEAGLPGISVRIAKPKRPHALA